jgi:hypothetical protein
MERKIHALGKCKSMDFELQSLWFSRKTGVWGIKERIK